MDQRLPEPAVGSRNYDRVAAVYEMLANLYSFGLIREAKMAELEAMTPGMRVLYLGVGSGEDAVAAARAGAEVTAIDLSERMIARLRRRMDRAGLGAELIAGDVMAFRPERPFDAVCGNYFFNVFSPADMERVLAHAVSFVRPGGLMMIADMAPQKGPFGPLGWLYLKAGLSVFWLLGLAAQHPIYDYAAVGSRHGLSAEAVRDFGLPGLALYRTVVLRRPAEAPAWT